MAGSRAKHTCRRLQKEKRDKQVSHSCICTCSKGNMKETQKGNTTNNVSCSSICVRCKDMKETKITPLPPRMFHLEEPTNKWISHSAPPQRGVSLLNPSKTVCFLLNSYSERSPTFLVPPIPTLVRPWEAAKWRRGRKQRAPWHFADTGGAVLAWMSSVPSCHRFLKL